VDFNRPKHLNGGQSQALFYHLATMAGLEVWTEYSVTLTAEGWAKPHWTRFDAVIVHKDEIIAIVECKDRKWMLAYQRRQKRHDEPIEQEQRYLAYGLPLYFVNDEADIHQTIELLYALRETVNAAMAQRQWPEVRK